MRRQVLHDGWLGPRSSNNGCGESSDVQRPGIRIDDLPIQPAVEIQRFVRSMRDDFAVAHHVESIIVHDLTDVVRDDQDGAVVLHRVGRPGNNTIRHMTFDPATRQIWFGTDQGTIGRISVPPVALLR